MQRTKLTEYLNQQPVQCTTCKKNSPSYFNLLSQNKKPHCYQCIKNNQHLLKNITISYKQYYQTLFNNVPLPDIQFAQLCTKSLDQMKNDALKIIKDLKNSIEQFQLDISQFYTYSKIICQGYIQKIKKISQTPVQTLIKGKFSSFNQQKYSRKIQQKYKISLKIKQLLQQLKVKIPSVKQVTKNFQKQIKRYSIGQVPINSSIEIRGTIFFGTADGKIIYQNNNKNLILKAHDSLIRSLAYDGQFTLFSGSDDFKIKAWNIRNKQKLQLIKQFGSVQNGGKSYHRDILVFNNGRTMASTRGTHDQFKIRLWQLKQYKNTKFLEGHQNYIHGMCMILENQIITVSDDKTLRVWNTNSGQCSKIFYHSKKILRVHGNKQRQLICICDQENRAMIISNRKLQVIQNWPVVKKILCSQGKQKLYFGISTQILVYNWYGIKLFTHSLQTNFVPGNMLQVQNKLVVCDGKGKCLQIPFVQQDQNNQKQQTKK